MNVGIYIIRNLKNGKMYVGSSVDIPTRWRTHRSALEKGKHHSTKLQRAWVKYGEDAFSFEIVAFELEHGQRIALEQWFIESNHAATCGYNIYPAAGSPLNYRHSQESRKKISLALKDKKKHADHGAKVSAARKGMIVSEKKIARLAEIRPKQHTLESRMKMSAAQIGNTNRRGIKSSDETKARQSAALKGKPKSEEARRNIAAAIRRRFGKTDPAPLSGNTEVT